MALLGLDVGSSGCKAMVFDTNGKQLAYSYIEYPPFENVYETNGNIIWGNVTRVIKDCTAQVKEKITALCISSFGESFVPIDKDGKVLMNTMLYTDIRGKEQCDRLVKFLSKDKIMSISGVNPHPMYSLSKICYIKENHPEIYEKTFKFLLIGSFCAYMLTGEAIIDYSLAARTMAFDVIKKEWSNFLLNGANIDIEKLPKPIPSGTIIGKIKPNMADNLSLPNDLLVVAGGHDQICAALGAGVVDTSIAIDGMGTVECITPIFDKPILTEEFLSNNYACVPYVIDGMYATYAFNFTGGSILKWFKNNFATYEAVKAKELGISVYELLDNEGAKKPTDLIVIPHFAGSATPDMNNEARGAFLGLKFDTNRATLYRALIEGVTYEMKYNMEILEQSGIKISELRAVGGGAKSDYWLNIKASITGKTIVPLDVDEAGIVGAVILAGVATGVYRNINEAVGIFVKKRNAVEPNIMDNKFYEENYKKYKIVRKSIANLYK